MRIAAVLFTAATVAALAGTARFGMPKTSAWLDAVFLVSSALCVALLLHGASRHLDRTFGAVRQHNDH